MFSPQLRWKCYVFNRLMLTLIYQTPYGSTPKPYWESRGKVKGWQRASLWPKPEWAVGEAQASGRCRPQSVTHKNRRICRKNCDFQIARYVEIPEGRHIFVPGSVWIQSGGLCGVFWLPVVTSWSVPAVEAPDRCHSEICYRRNMSPRNVNYRDVSFLWHQLLDVYGYGFKVMHTLQWL